MDKRDEDGRDAASRRTLELTSAERELLRRACQRYRAAVPTYLKSKDEERQLLDLLIEKLAEP